MTPAEEFAWAYSHAYDRSGTHNEARRCPFCKEDQR